MAPPAGDGVPGARRVWIVNHYGDAPDRPAGTRHFDLARRLVAGGCAVTIFAAGFSNVTHREQRLTGRRLYRSERFDGVRFVWLRTVPYAGNTWRRPLNMLSYVAAFLVVQTRFAAPDTVIGSTVHPFAAFGGWLVAWRRHARFLFEVRDLWPQTLIDLGAVREGSPGARLLRSLEAFLVHRADFVITLLPGMRDYLAGRGLPTGNVVYLPNGVDLAEFDAWMRAEAGAGDPVRPALGEVGRLREAGRCVFGYLGSFGHVNAVEVIVRAAAIAEERAPGRIGLALVGDGPERSGLERLATGLPNVTVCPPVPRRSVPLVLRALDATVVHARATPVYRYGISFNKLFDYMAASRPVAFACASAYDPVQASGAGITVPPDDPERLADALLELAAAGPERRAEMGAAGRAFVAREHDIAQLGARLADLIACPGLPR